MTIHTNEYGFTVITDIIDGHRVERKYMGYSHAEAVEAFYEEFPQA